jgi:hypothetical protein
MLKKIPLSFFQICSIMLFLFVLLSVPINKFLISMNSILLLFIYTIIFIFINTTVFIGYFKIAKEQNLKFLKPSSIVVAITLFFYDVSNTIFAILYNADELKGNPLIIIVNVVLGLVLIYFSITLFICKSINNRSSIPFGVISTITSLIFVSYIFIAFSIFTQWFFYGAVAFYLFPYRIKKEYVNLVK